VWIKEDIFAMDSEAENHKSATGKILNDLTALHGNVSRTIAKQKRQHFLRISFSLYAFFLAQQSTTF